MEFEVRITAQAEMFGNRLRKNVRRLKSWVRSREISCYRIYDRDIPEVPLSVDWYEGYLHIAEYARRSTSSMSDEAHEQWIDAIICAGSEALGVEMTRVFRKQRENQRGKKQYERLSSEGSVVVVSEGGHRFQINLSDYLDTGLFLDHRKTRALIGASAEGKDVLNLFGYTGSFSVYAAAGGAKTTTTVDLSRTYLSWTRRNFELNKISMDSGRHTFVHDGVRRFLDGKSRQGALYDIIVVDPPTFSNSKRMDDHFDVQRDHGALLMKALKVMSQGGVVYFSTNSRRFRMDSASLGHAEMEDITEETIPRDYRDRRIHKCYRIRRSSQGISDRPLL